MATSNYDEIRRVRHEMSAAAGHDVHKLIAAINQLRDQHADKIIAPGKAAEQCDAPKPPITPTSHGSSTPAVG